MCGICGIFDMKNEHRVSREVIESMAGKLRHRGPDSMDCYIKENIALGFTRLSIIDIEGGMQPISNEDGTVVLVCNGEIFNYLELREQLLAKGHRFKTNCDVEVVLHLYEEKHMEFINDLNGQFAFALYDLKKGRVLCARDYAGIAPFFYTIADNSLIFASEIKSILEHPGVKREVDLVGLDQIMSFPGLVSPRTMFKNIHSLEAGHYLLVNGDGVRNAEYWDLKYPGVNETDDTANEEYYVEKLDDLLTRAVKYRLQADVPVGFYISGGLDSSIIASKIKQVDNSGVRHSFSIDFTEKDISEGKFQRIMAGHVASIHHERLFGFPDIGERLQKAVYHSECALKETYNTASLTLSQLVRGENIKVVLTGEGADELFGGYVGYRFDRLRQKQAAPGKSPESEIQEKLWGDENFIYEKSHLAYQKTKQELYSDNINSMYHQVECTSHPVINTERVKNVDVFHRRSYIDFKLRMADHLLSDHGDRMAFANSVEARYPFLDKNLIEFASAVPVDMKLKGFNEKYILKKLAGGLVPEEIINRPKFAFVAPGSPELLKRGPEWVADLLSYERIKRQGYFNPETVEKLKRQYTQEEFKLNVPYDSDMLIIVITFGIFLELFNMPDLN